MRLLLPLLLVLHAAACAAQDIYTAVRLDIRPEADDFAPVLIDSGFVMTSLRTRDQAIEYTDETTGAPLADLYTVRLRNGKPGRPRLLDGTLCTPLNDGPAAFADSGSTICITRNQPRAKGLRGSRDGDHLGLFFAHKQGHVWSEVSPFAFNSPTFSCMHASFSGDGQRLYFASDMPGGQGGTDLYVCTRTGEGWSMPQNLGPIVNGPSNELFPFAGLDGRILFSSDRAGGLGQLDIYASGLEDGAWSAPEALPAPMNSAGNDLGFTAYPDGLSGLFSSDREGGDRIFRFTRHPELFRDCVAQQRNNYCYVFEDKGTFNTDTLPLRYEWDLGDGTRVAGLSATHCYAAPGAYTVKLNIVDTLTKSIFFNEASYDLVVSDVEQAFIDVPDSLATGTDVAFGMEHTFLPGFTAVEQHWDLGDGTSLTGPAPRHAYATAGTYTVRLDLLGRPDTRGRFTNHCVTRTVRVIDGFAGATAFAGERINSNAPGFDYHELPADELKMTILEGEDALLSVQLFASPERISLNDARFSSIRKYYPVIERFDPATRLYSYSVGAATTLAGIYAVYAQVKELQYLGAEVTVIHQEKLVDMARLSGLPLEALNGSVLRISTVLFKTGQRTFDVAFGPTLDQVMAIVRQHPQVDLVIEAHTDDVGTEESNLALSQGRAQSILDYFVAHGVPSARLKPIGFGENRPLADNTTANGRSLNRRVEFRLTVRTDIPPDPDLDIAHP